MTVWLAALALGALWPPAADSQGLDPWGEVVAWEGRIEATESGSIGGDSSGEWVVFSRSVQKRSVTRFTLQRDRDRSDPASGIHAWTGGGEITAENVNTRNERDGRGRGVAITKRSSGTVPATDFSLYIDRGRGVVEFGYGAEAEMWTETTTGEYFHEEKDQASGRFNIRTESASATAETNQWAHAPFELEYPLPSPVPGVLVFSAEQMIDDYLGEGVFGGPLPKLTQSGRLTLWPVFADVEVAVTIEGYDTWRPLGSIANPQSPGSQLVATATLEPKGGRAARDLPEVRRLRFQLVDTSREPGVCLNWPLGAEDRDPDLRLALARTPGVLGEEDQELTADDPPTDRDGRPFATVRVDAFDFGARSELRVIAELEDGREVSGFLRAADGTRAAVWLPARPPGGWIAASWRQQHRVEALSDGDDAENEPLGNGFKGDGLTLYEEYRGFAVRGRHVSGDPQRKDFFILNLVGSDAWPGIHLFERISGLRVHHRLASDEMSLRQRVINANYRDAPHRVDQHGVVLRVVTEAEMGHTGAQVFLVRWDGPFQPANVEKIGILARDDPRAAFNTPFNLPAGDLAVAYDSFIAHELAHAVGAHHHGEGDPGPTAFYFLFADDPRNPTGQARFLRAPVKARAEVELLDEATGESMAARLTPFFEALRNRWREINRERLINQYRSLIADGKVSTQEFADAETWADVDLNDRVGTTFLLGSEHGQHSGEESCAMRYTYAQVYQASGGRPVYYLIPPGTDRIGLELCRSAAGTGSNAPTHRPQARFGAATVGNCAGQINVNDAAGAAP